MTDPVGELEDCRARLRVVEDLAQLMAEALAMVPASAMTLSGVEWFPSPEALALIRLAQDRYAEFSAE